MQHKRVADDLCFTERSVALMGGHTTTHPSSKLSDSDLEERGRFFFLFVQIFDVQM
jgi:hypothetical protein